MERLCFKPDFRALIGRKEWSAEDEGQSSLGQARRAKAHSPVKTPRPAAILCRDRTILSTMRGAGEYPQALVAPALSVGEVSQLPLTIRKEVL